jgi:Uncharacterised nucleotidyltransferase
MSTDGRVIHEDVLEETVRLLAAAEQESIPVRALGGMAVVLHVGELLHPAFRREIRDLDLATPKRAQRKVDDFLVAQGYTPNGRFNAVHGARRLLFYDEPNGRQIDVFVGTFAMCHEIPLMERLTLEPLTLPLAELLMTKLQIVKLNRKDEFDLYSLLLTHEIGADDNDTINAERISSLCARDWGLYRTFQLNLGRLLDDIGLPDLGDDERVLICARIGALQEAIEAAPKTTKWKVRARVGDRVRWYEDPDEIDSADNRVE